MGTNKNNSPLNQSIMGGIFNSVQPARGSFGPVQPVNSTAMNALASANTGGMISMPGMPKGATQSFGGFFGQSPNVTSAAATAAQGAMIREQQKVKQQMNNTGNTRQFMPRPQTPINPKAMSNQGNINAMFGQEMPGTFNRNVNGSPLMQMTSQGYVPPADPTNYNVGPDVKALITGNTGQPIMPPVGVQQEITPTYDLSNQ